MSKTERLEMHRKRREAEGHRGSMLRMDELEPDEKRLVSDEVFSEIKRLQVDGSDIYVAYAAVMAKWGIMCSHPRPRRRFADGRYSETPMPDDEWFECEVCRTTVINDEWRQAHPDQRDRSVYLRIKELRKWAGPIQKKHQ